MINSTSSFFNECLEPLSKSIVTPCYLFSEALLRANWQMIYTAFAARWPDIEIAYSYKTNPLMKICSIFHECGAWAEVTSGHELALSAKLKPYDHIFNGIYKTEKEVQEAVSRSALINLDGDQQVELATSIAHRAKSVMRIGLRIKSDGAWSGGFDRFGFKADPSYILAVAKRLASIENIEVCCLHTHIDTNIRTAEVYAKAAYILGDLSVKLKSAGIAITMLDLGGGFVSSTDQKVFEKYADSIVSGLHEANASPELTIIIEPGRALVENSGILVTRVLEVRTGSRNGEDHAIIDAGINCAMGVDFFGNREVIALPKDDHRKKRKLYTIMGPLCSQKDILAEKVLLPTLSVGDILYILDAGGYDLSTSYSFSRLRPCVYLQDVKGNIQRIRREEETEDVLRLELNNFC